MSEKKNMQWALDLAIVALRDMAELADEQQWSRDTIEDYRIASNMLREGGPVVEKSEDEVWCDYCNMPWTGCRCLSDKTTIVYMKRSWTEREKIKIVTEESDETFK